MRHFDSKSKVLMVIVQGLHANNFLFVASDQILCKSHYISVQEFLSTHRRVPIKCWLSFFFTWIHKSTIRIHFYFTALTCVTETKISKHYLAFSTSLCSYLILNSSPVNIRSYNLLMSYAPPFENTVKNHGLSSGLPETNSKNTFSIIPKFFCSILFVCLF